MPPRSAARTRRTRPRPSGLGIGEGERQRRQPRNLVPARRDHDRGRLSVDRHRHRDIAVAVVPAAAEAVVEGEADRPHDVPVPTHRPRADVDPTGIGDLLPYPHLDPLDRDVAEAEVAAAAQAVVQEQTDRPERVPPRPLGPGADLDAQWIADVLPDAHVDIGGAPCGVPRVGARCSNAGNERQRHHEGAQESARECRATVHGAGAPPWRWRHPSTLPDDLPHPAHGEPSGEGAGCHLLICVPGRDRSLARGSSPAPGTLEPTSRTSPAAPAAGSASRREGSRSRLPECLRGRAWAGRSRAGWGRPPAP